MSKVPPTVDQQSDVDAEATTAGSYSAAFGGFFVEVGGERLKRVAAKVAFLVAAFTRLAAHAAVAGCVIVVR